jgi:hypothetical protein
MRLLIASAAFAALMAPHAALAGETISYKYDARGRLVKVERSGTINNGVTSDYSFDKANNRVSLTVAGAGSGGAALNQAASGDELATEAMELDEQSPAPNDTSSAVGENVFFSVDDPDVGEGGDLLFAVIKTGATSQSLTVDYSTDPGSAGTSDYGSRSGSLTFAPADRIKYVVVPALADAQIEPNETVLLNISGAVPISDAQGVGTILAGGGQ